MNEIQDPTAALRLVRKYGLRERFPLSTVVPELQPVVIVDDLSGPDQPTRIPDATGGAIRTSAPTEQPHFFLRNGTFGTAELLNRTGVNLLMDDALVFSAVAGRHIRAVVASLSILNPAGVVNGSESYADNSRRPIGVAIFETFVPCIAQVGSYPAAAPSSGRLDWIGYTTTPGPTVVDLRGWIIPEGRVLLIEVEDESAVESICRFRWREVPVQPQIG